MFQPVLDDLIRPESKVLAMSADQAFAWIIGETLVSKQIHWHAIAEGAAFRATAEDGPDRPIWAKVSLVAYTFLIRYSGEVTGNTYEQSAMALKVSMIARGFVDLAWTPEGVIDWFRRAALMTHEQVEQRLVELDAAIKADPRSNVVHHKLFVLRKLKNKIYVLLRLAECKGVELPEDIKAWIELHPRLP